MVEARQVRPLHPDFGVEVMGLDLGRDLTVGTVELLDGLLRRDRVVVVRGQRLAPLAQLRVGASLGPLHGTRPSRYGPWAVPEIRYETGDTTSVRSNYNERWHADLSWVQNGSPVTLLHAIEAGAGCAPTAFADMIGAYRALDASTSAAVDRWQAYHHVARSRDVRYGPMPPAPPPGSVTGRVRRTVVRRYRELRWSVPQFRARLTAPPAPPGALHPVIQTDTAGRRFVHAGDHAWSLAGLPEPEGLALLDELNRLVVAAEHVYEHRWAPGDLVLFENRSLLHRRLPFGDAAARRLLRRCVVWHEGGAEAQSAHR
jgi:taurine dioxygenase